MMHAFRPLSRWSMLPVIALLAAGCSEEAMKESPVAPQYAKATNRPPVANPGGPYMGIVNVPVQLDGTRTTDPDGPSNKLQYTWTIRNGSTLVATLQGATPQWTSSALGTYAVTLTVKDAKGATASAQTTITIVHNIAPALQVVGNATIVPGQAYFLTLVIKDTGDPGPWYYEVDWGNGAPITYGETTLSPVTLESSYAATGSFNVSVSLSDNKEGGTATGTATVNVVVATGPPVLIGAGDIAGCATMGDSETDQLINGVVGTVFTSGDNAYPDGTLAEFLDCYGPTWGRHKPYTRPSPGNHEYYTAGGAGYYGYFGGAAGEAGKGYYSYDLGSWHIIALNSNIARDAASAQVQWLRDDLLANADAQCTLAYWHHPRWSSGPHGGDATVAPFVEALHEFGADVIIVGHDHLYERFAPQLPNGTADDNGIRQFVVGTGGRSLYSFGTPQPNSEVRYNATYGVIKLVLDAGSYSWDFIPVSGSFSDPGSGVCH